MKNTWTKKILALALSLVMTLTCTAASAVSIQLKTEVNKDAAAEMLNGAGMPESGLSAAGTIIDLVNVLGLKMTIVEDGGQVDLDLEGNTALSLGWQNSEDGVTLVSDLFPSYVLTVKNETIGQLLEQFQTYLPGFNAEDGMMGAAGGMNSPNMAAIREIVEKYGPRFATAFTTATVTGDPVEGKYEFEGVAFDIMVPVTVDMETIRTAFHNMMEEMLKDEAVLAMIGSFAQGQEIDAEQIRKAVEKFENHFPDSVTAETYTNGDGTPPMYVAGQASYSGREEPSFTYTMMMKDQRNCNILLMCKEQELDIGVTVAENFMRIEFAKDPVSAALEISFEHGEYLKDIIRFYLNSEEPLTVTELTVDQNGGRTLPTEPGNRTVLAIEDATNNKAAVIGFQGEVIQNGTALLNELQEAVPGLGDILSLVMNRGSMTVDAEYVPAESEEPEEPEVPYEGENGIGSFFGPRVTGGWSATDDYEVTEEVAEVVRKGLDGLIGVGYEPVALLGTQVVAGTNYAVLCKGQVVAPDAESFWTILYLYEDLTGNVSILRFQNVTLSAQGED